METNEKQIDAEELQNVKNFTPPSPSADFEANDDDLCFDLEIKHYPVKFKEKDGTISELVLHELDGTQRDKFLNQLGDRTRIMKDGTTKMKNYDGMQADLLHRCLYRKDTEKYLTVKEIQQLPSRVVNKLFSKAQKISDLGESDSDEAKND